MLACATLKESLHVIVDKSFALIHVMDASCMLQKIAVGEVKEYN